MSPGEIGQDRRSRLTEHWSLHSLPPSLPPCSSTPDLLPTFWREVFLAESPDTPSVPVLVWTLYPSMASLSSAWKSYFGLEPLCFWPWPLECSLSSLPNSPTLRAGLSRTLQHHQIHELLYFGPTLIFHLTASSEV